MAGLLACAIAMPIAADGPATEPSPDLKKATAYEKGRLFLKVIDQEELLIGNASRPEHETFCDLAIHAHRFTTDELLSVAHRDVGHADLMLKNDALRENWRYELVRFDGRLKRLKRIGTYPELEKAGIAELYEAWIFPKNTDNPICVILTEVPDGIVPDLDYSPSKPVTVAGYYFKILRYESDQPNAKTPGKGLARQAPLLIGRSLILRTDIGPSPSAALPALLPIVILGAGLVVGGLVLFTVLLRRSDAGLRRYRIRAKQNPFPDAANPALPTNPPEEPRP